MIYKKYLLLGVSLCMLNACNESKSVSLEGSLDGIQADSIYLYQVDNEHYGSVKLIKSIAVTDGRFAYPTDSIQAGLYCFSLQNMERGEYLQQYANLFLEPKSMQLTLGKDKYDQLSLHATGSAFIIRKSKFPQNPKRSVRFSGKRTKRSVQKRKARNTQKAETKVL